MRGIAVIFVQHIEPPRDFKGPSVTRCGPARPVAHRTAPALVEPLLVASMGLPGTVTRPLKLRIEDAADPAQDGARNRGS